MVASIKIITFGAVYIQNRCKDKQDILTMQENKQEKSQIKRNISLYLSKKGVTPYEFYKKSGVTRGVLAQDNGISEENLTRFLAYAPDVSPVWLLTGEGPMLKNETRSSREISPSEPSPQGKYTDNNLNSQENPPEKSTPNEDAENGRGAIATHPTSSLGGLRPIPLVTAGVAAGFGSADFNIAEADISDFYVIPKFRHIHVDFIVEVHGTSMQPHYHPGDAIACSILRDSRFIQWNKCHVIATREQGLLVKRLMPAGDDDHIRAVSDNPDFPPFDIPRDEITGLALVIGGVFLE